MAANKNNYFIQELLLLIFQKENLWFIYSCFFILLLIFFGMVYLYKYSSFNNQMKLKIFESNSKNGFPVYYRGFWGCGIFCNEKRKRTANKSNERKSL